MQQVTFLQDTSKVDICTKRVISHQLTEEMVVAHCRLQFESHQWIFLRTPGDFSRDQNRFCFLFYGMLENLQLQLTERFLCRSVVTREEKGNSASRNAQFEVIGGFAEMFSGDWVALRSRREGGEELCRLTPPNPLSQRYRDNFLISCCPQQQRLKGRRKQHFFFWKFLVYVIRADH